MKMKRYFGSLLLLAISVAGCSQKSLEPRDPLWGRESCAHCRMAVSLEKFAAQKVEDSGRYSYFDDLGCALEYESKHPELQGTLYVRPEGHSVWVKAVDARYKDGFSSPMNYGFAAVSNGGKFSLEEVRARLKESRHP